MSDPADNSEKIEAEEKEKILDTEDSVEDLRTEKPDSEDKSESDVGETANTEKEGKSEIDAVREEMKTVNDKYLRLHSEFDNFRRRTAKENLALVATANAELITSLLDVVDNFERAFSDEHKADNLEAFEKGIELIRGQLQKILAAEGLVAIDPTGEEFDPMDQEAMVQQPSEEIPENHVLMTYQKGYKLNDKTIRPAKVIVSSGPESGEQVS